MIDNNIKRFCELVSEIKELNDYLYTERFYFYDGEFSFEECFSYDIEKLVNLQNEFRNIMINLNN